MAWAEEPAAEAATSTVEIIRPADGTGIAEGKSITFKTNLSAEEASQYAAQWRVDDVELTRCAARAVCEIGAGFAPGSHTVSVSANIPKGSSTVTRTLWILGSPRVAFVGGKAGSIAQGEVITLRVQASNVDELSWQLRTVGTYGVTPLAACANSTECAVGDGLAPGSYEVQVTARNEQVPNRATDRFTLTVTPAGPGPGPGPDEPIPGPGPAPAPADPGDGVAPDTKTLANTGAGNAAGGISLLLLGLAGACFATGAGGGIIRKLIAADSCSGA